MKLVQIKSASVTLADKAYQAIKDAIIILELKPGQFIYEKDIANLLKVSRTPVREAFRQLKVVQMVDVFPQKGIQITLISKKKIEEVRFIRESLELSCFIKVAKMWDSDNDKCKELGLKVSQALNDEEESIKNKDYYSFLKSDEEFHYHILNFIGNDTLLDVISQMRDHLNRIRYMEYQESQHMIYVMNQHRDIFQAITENNEDRVAQILMEHIGKLKFLDKLTQKYSEYFTD